MIPIPPGLFSTDESVRHATAVGGLLGAMVAISVGAFWYCWRLMRK